MKIRPFLLPGALVANLALSGYLLMSREDAPAEKSDPVVKENQAGEALEELAGLRELVTELQGQVELNSAPLDEDDPRLATTNDRVRQMAERLEAMEHSLTGYQNALADLEIEEAAAKRDELFRAADGDVKAAEYYAAGEYALAGEGYLTFLAAHPDHPQHRSIVKKARQAFMRAGNIDKAIAVHEEFMELYPENRPTDLMTLAHMQKESGNYEEAAQSAKDSAGLVNDTSKYWNLLYSAWYTQLGDGLNAGLAAHRNVQEQINAAGLSDSKVAERVQLKISEIENQIAAEGK